MEVRISAESSVELHILVELRGPGAPIASTSVESLASGAAPPPRRRNACAHRDGKNLGALIALDQDFHRPVRKLQHLQNVRRSQRDMSSGPGSSFAADFWATRRMLRPASHGKLHRLDRLGAAHEKRYHHVRKDNDIPQTATKGTAEHRKIFSAMHAFESNVKTRMSGLTPAFNADPAHRSGRAATLG